MATASSTLLIGLGAPTVSESSLTILSIGQDGDPTAQQILTHPDSDNFPPIVFYRNPDFITNLDNVVLRGPDARLQKTSSSSKLLRQEQVLEDIVCELTWGAQQGTRASMPTFLFRQLYEYLINPPTFSATAQTYIEWQPRDKSLLTYNVELYQIRVGGGSGANVFNVHDYRLPTTTIANPLDTMDVSPTGLVDQAVTVSLRTVSEV